MYSRVFISKLAHRIIRASNFVVKFNDINGYSMEDEAKHHGIGATLSHDGDKWQLEMDYVDYENNYISNHVKDNSKKDVVEVPYSDNIAEFINSINKALDKFYDLNELVYDPKARKWSDRDSGRVTMTLAMALKRALGITQPKGERLESNQLNDTLKDFVAYVQDMSDKYMEKQFPSLEKYKFSIDVGGRYMRIVKNDGAQRSVYCFVDKTNGDILKAAGWKAPAKGARGNIYNKNTWSSMTPYGAPYKR